MHQDESLIILSAYFSIIWGIFFYQHYDGCKVFIIWILISLVIYIFILKRPNYFVYSTIFVLAVWLSIRTINNKSIV